MISIVKARFARVRRFFESMGLVEQSQVVASTAVVVAMVTIVSAHLSISRKMDWLGFVSVVTVGIIGFVSVYFSLKYGRMLEAQRKDLLELNTIGEAVNYSVELRYVLQSALTKVMELMRADCGWIYLNERHTLVLKHQHGAAVPILPSGLPVDSETLEWIHRPNLRRLDECELANETIEGIGADRDASLASIPLVRQGEFAGVMIIASLSVKKFDARKIELLQAFGNQVSVALNNASLFEQVRQSEKLYSDLYEQSPDMYHSVDRNGIVVSCNRTESEMLGIPKEEIVGRPLLRLYPPSMHAQVREHLRRIFEEAQTPKGVEEQIQRGDGTLIDVSLSTSIVFDADGKPAMARMVLRDITEKKKLETKILQAQKIDSIGNLAGGIAHDFNNVLTAILGSASIMRRKMQNDPKWLKYVELIETTSRRGAAVTRQLLTFARKNSPQAQPVDINPIIDQTIRLFEATTPKTIHIKLSLSEEPVVILGDEAQLQQALLNLCLNARDAMPNGGILLVDCRPVRLDQAAAREFLEGRPGDYVRITVTDSGMGIPREILSQIYEPFFTTKEQGKGTGLGLSVVYGVVQSHRGFISVESEVDSGTVFTLYFPREQNAGNGRSGRTLAEPVGGSERILLIEDEISIGVVGSDILAELGYDIAIAHNGKEALQMLANAERPFSLVVLDMNMPRMGGRATFDQIKDLFPSIKVLVCSGYSATMIDDGNFTRSIDGFVQKPYELEDFAQRVRAVLDAPSRSAVPR
jgi:PAS domain S-box-containing protein